MIAFVRGILIDKYPDMVIVDVGGMGFEVMVHSRAVAVLPGRGQEVILYTRMQVSDNDYRLYGFVEKDELELFKTLINITGLGPKIALAILGHFDPQRFYHVIAAQDLKALTLVPGVGKKSGERILFELKDRMPEVAAVVRPPASQLQVEELLEALQALGYSRSEVYPTVSRMVESDDTGTIEENIRKVLKAMAGSKGK